MVRTCSACPAAGLFLKTTLLTENKKETSTQRFEFIVQYPSILNNSEKHMRPMGHGHGQQLTVYLRHLPPLSTFLPAFLGNVIQLCYKGPCIGWGPPWGLMCRAFFFSTASRANFLEIEQREGGGGRCASALGARCFIPARDCFFIPTG